MPKRPEKVEGIEVEKTFKKLYIFHGAGLQDRTYTKSGTVIGRYEVEYEDDSRATIPIVEGENVRDWGRDRKPLIRAKLGWVGMNPKVRLILTSLRLYVTMWENPHPDKRVIAIDFISTTTHAAPFCLAMTVEDGTDSTKGEPADPATAGGKQAVPGKDE